MISAPSATSIMRLQTTRACRDERCRVHTSRATGVGNSSPLNGISALVGDLGAATVPPLSSMAAKI
eukprot:5406716-Pleurochrysis_carterae.AAC.2